MVQRCFSKKASNLFWVKSLLTVSLAYSISLLPAFADPIVPDGRTATSLATSGNTTTISTLTNDGRGNAFNSFSNFNVSSGQTVNLVVPDTANNLINLVTSSATNINGTLNALKNNQIGGNVFLINPYGITISSSGVVNVGSLTAIVPNTTFANSIMDATGNINASAVDSILANNTTLSNKIENYGKINAINNVALSAMEINNNGNIYTGASFQQTGPNIGDVVNINTLDQNPNLAITNGKIDIVTYDHFRNNGIVDAKEVNMYIGEIDMNSSGKIIGSESVAIGSKYGSVIGVSDVDRPDNVSASAHSPSITPTELNQMITPKLILGKDFDTANPRMLSIIILDSFTRNGDLVLQSTKYSPSVYTSLDLTGGVSVNVNGNLTINNQTFINATIDSTITANNIYLNSKTYNGLDQIAGINAPNGKVVLSSYDPQDVGIGSAEFIKPTLLGKINANEVVVGNDTKTNNNTANVTVKESLTIASGLTLAATQTAKVNDGISVVTTGDFTTKADTTQIGVGSNVTAANVKLVSDKLIIDTTSANTQINAPTGTVLISRSTAGNVKVGNTDLTDATNLYLTPAELSKISSANLTLGNNPTHFNNTDNVEITTPITKSGNLTLVSKGDVLIKSNITLTNGGSLDVNAGDDAVLAPYKTIAADGSVKLAAGDISWARYLSQINAKGDIIMNAGNLAIVGLGTQLNSENNINISGKNIVTKFGSALTAKNNIIMNAGNDVSLAGGSFLHAINQDIQITAGNNLYLSYFTCLKAGRNIILKSNNPIKKNFLIDIDFLYEDSLYNEVLKN